MALVVVNRRLKRTGTGTKGSLFSSPPPLPPPLSPSPSLPYLTRQLSLSHILTLTRQPSLVNPGPWSQVGGNSGISQWVPSLPAQYPLLPFYSKSDQGLGRRIISSSSTKSSPQMGMARHHGNPDDRWGIHALRLLAKLPMHFPPHFLSGEKEEGRGGGSRVQKLPSLVMFPLFFPTRYAPFLPGSDVMYSRPASYVYVGLCGCLPHQSDPTGTFPHFDSTIQPPPTHTQKTTKTTGVLSSLHTLWW